MQDLPDTTLAGIGLLMAGIGGVASYYSELKKNKKASLRSNLGFAIMVALVFGLLSYKYLVITCQVPAVWFAILLISGFANQVLLKVIEVSAQRNAEKILHITENKEIEINLTKK